MLGSDNDDSQSSEAAFTRARE